MKNVGPIRRELGVKTFFNMLGPMVNPSFPPNQLVGVFSLELARLYGYLYQKSDKRFSILHALDGYDEISLTSDFKMISNDSESLISPEDMKMKKLTQSSLYGGETVEDAREIFKNVLMNKGTEQQSSVVLANAGVAISTVKRISVLEGVEFAKESLQSGKALNALKKFLEVNR